MTKTQASSTAEPRMVRGRTRFDSVAWSVVLSMFSEEVHHASAPAMGVESRDLTESMIARAGTVPGSLQRGRAAASSVGSYPTIAGSSPARAIHGLEASFSQNLDIPFAPTGSSSVSRPLFPARSQSKQLPSLGVASVRRREDSGGTRSTTIANGPEQTTAGEIVEDPPRPSSTTTPSIALPGAGCQA